MIALLTKAFLIATVELGPVGFSGNAQFMFEYDTLTGVTQTAPALMARWQFNPSISFYGLPISLNLSLSSVKNGFLNQLEAWTLTFEPQKMLSYMPSLPGFLFSFPMISFGNTNPEFSSLTLYGTSVDGFTVKYSPGKFYIALTRGKLTQVDSVLGEVYPRRVLGYKVGVGAPDGAHLHLTYAHFLDDTTGFSISDSNPPRENFIMGLNMGMNLKHMHLQAEIAGSEVTDDIRDSIIEVEKMPQFLIKQFKPRVSTHADYAARVRIASKIKGTSFKVYGQYVGPGYESFGTAILKNDAIEYGAEFRTAMLHGMVSLGGNYRTSKDNILGIKGITTQNTIYHIDISVAPPNLPFLQLSLDQTSQMVEDTASFTSRMIMASAGYPYIIRNMSLFSQLSLSYQNSDTPDTLYHAQSYGLITVSQSLAFKFPLTLSATMTYGKFKSDTMQMNRSTFDFSASYTVKKFMPVAGVSYSSSDDENRTNLYLRASYRPGWDVTISSSLLYGMGNKSGSGSFSEKKFTFLIGKTW